MVLDPAHSAAYHGAYEERGREHSTRRPADKGEARSQHLKRRQRREHLPDVLAVHRLIDHFVAGAHHLREPEPDDPDPEAGRRGLQIMGPPRKGLQAWTKVAHEFHEGKGREPADDSQNRVGQELRGMHQPEDGDSKQRLIAEEAAHDHHAGDGGEHNGAQDSGAPVADHFLHHKQHSGDGRVEGRCEARRRAHRRDQSDLVA